MKIKTFLCYATIMAFSLSCKKDENNPLMKGTLSLNVGLYVTIIEEDDNLKKSTFGAEDFLVTIFNDLGIQVMSFAEAADIPDEIELEPGQYYVTAHSNNNLAAAFSNPYYYGESPVFTINPGAQQTITVNCELANTIVTIIYSDQVKNSYSDFAATVSTSEGFLVYAKDETREGYFKTLPLNISVLLTWQKEGGSIGTKTLTGSIPNPLPRKKYEIHIDAASADGSAGIQINLDETIGSIEIINITGNDTPTAGIINTGDLLITEIMANPLALSDAIGEWFEIYNNTGQPIDLNHLVIRRNDTEHHTVTGNIILAPHAFYVMARTEDAVAGTKYIYGTSLTLTNTGANLAIYNYGTDGTDGSLISSVDYSAVGFPEANGSSICLSPLLLNYTNAMNGSSWCVSVSEYSTGDLGTPGTQNDSCL